MRKREREKEKERKREKERGRERKSEQLKSTRNGLILILFTSLVSEGNPQMTSVAMVIPGTLHARETI